MKYIYSREDLEGEGMKKLLILLLLSVYMMGCSNTSYKRDENGEIINQVYESPERIIDEYYKAIRRGDGEFLNELFVNSENLRVDTKIPEIEYRIIGSRIITRNEALERNQTTSRNRLQENDLEVIVEEVINNNSEEITFILRKINNRWKIYSHSMGYYI